MTRRKLALFERSLLAPAALDALRKLDPRVQWRNPVMFVVYIGSLLTTALLLPRASGSSAGRAGSARPAPCEVVAEGRIRDLAPRPRLRGGDFGLDVVAFVE